MKSNKVPLNKRKEIKRRRTSENENNLNFESFIYEALNQYFPEKEVIYENKIKKPKKTKK